MLVARMLHTGFGQLVGWRLTCTPDDFPSVRTPLDPPGLPPAVPIRLPGVHHDGYLPRSSSGRGPFDEFGPAMGWGRSIGTSARRRDPDDRRSVLVLADSGSGISLALDPIRHPAINCDLAVTLHRDPVTG